MNKFKLLIIALLTILISCNDDEKPEPEQLTKETLSGFVQKGPFINGTSITVSELDASLGQTGNTFNTQIVDNSGKFELKDLELSSPFVQLQADGFYFNEVIGEKSNAQLTLFALSDISSKDQINVNVLTHLEKGRVEFLINQEIEFSKAKDSAQHELLSAFGVDNQNIENSEELNISINNSGNATLIALSIILQANNSVADLTELLANINTDFRQDGIFNSESIRSQVYNEVQGLNLEEIRTNLEKRYSDLGLNADIPDFESVVDLYLISQKPYNIDAEITNVSCNGMNNGAIDITINEGSEPFVFEWSNGATTEDIDGLSPGSYSVYIVDGNGYEMKKENIEITEPLELTGNLTFENITQLGASDGNIEVNVIGGTPPYSYLWSNDSTSSQIDNLDKGVYSVIVSDSNSCEISLQTIIQEPIEISSVTTNISCKGNSDGSIELSIRGGVEPYSILWNSGLKDSLLTGLSAGTYTVTISDSLGYVTSDQFNINEPEPLNISSIVNNVSEIGANNGSITLDVSGGTAPYTYLWSNAATTKSLNNLEKGFYSVVIKDANECSYEFEYAVQEPIELLIEKSDVKCYREAQGSIILTINGGLEPYRINWDNGNNLLELSDLFAGNYSVEVIDALGASSTKSVTISQNDEISIDYERIFPTPGEADGLLTVFIDGGTPPYSYEWSNGSTNESSGPIGEGMFSFTITDALNCSKTISIEQYSAIVDSRDDEEYRVVKIGNQIWLAENLRATVFNDGSAIENVPGSSTWTDLIVPAYSWYNNMKTESKVPYGALYNWYAASNSKICPLGWHVPSDSELKTLAIELGISSSDAEKLGNRGTNQGSQLAGSKSLWTGGILTNNYSFSTSGFNAVPSGVRYGSGEFNEINQLFDMWSSTEYDPNRAIVMYIHYGYSDLGRGYSDKDHGKCIRCIKN